MPKESDFRPCIVCKEDASSFCRMCNSPYCWDHLCLHLSVARQENSYTARESLEREAKANPERSEPASYGKISGGFSFDLSKSTDFDFGANSETADKILNDDFLSETHTGNADRVLSPDENNPVQTNAKPLTAFTETELEQQHHFYISQARRIKRELERRSLPSSGFSFVGPEDSLLSRKQQKTKSRLAEAKPVAVRAKSPSVKITRAAEVLSNAIRQNNITLAQIMSTLKSSDSAPAK